MTLPWHESDPIEDLRQMIERVKTERLVFEPPVIPVPEGTREGIVRELEAAGFRVVRMIGLRTLERDARFEAFRRRSGRRRHAP